MLFPLRPSFLALAGRSLACVPDAPEPERCVVLSSFAKARLEVAPMLRREVVLMPETLGEDDARLVALALHAHLARLGPDAWRLDRRAAVRRALERADRDWLLQRAAAAARQRDLVSRYGDDPSLMLKALRAAQAKLEGRAHGGVVDDTAMEAGELSPAARLLADLLARMPADTLAAAVPGRTTVFCNAPVGDEQPLPGGQEALATYLPAQERYALWRSQTLDETQIPERYRSAFPQVDYHIGGRTIRLLVNRLGAEPWFSVVVYGPAGEQESVAALSAALPGGPPSVVKASLGSAALPAEAVAAMEAATPGRPEFRAESLDPSARDPLDLFVRNALLLYGKAKGYDQVVACVPDDLMRPIREARRGARVDLDAVGAALARFGCEELPRGGRWWCAQPCRSSRKRRGSTARPWRRPTGARRPGGSTSTRSAPCTRATRATPRAPFSTSASRLSWPRSGSTGRRTGGFPTRSSPPWDASIRRSADPSAKGTRCPLRGSGSPTSCPA